jgi:SAM-dependent methyltransferase
VCGNRAGNRVFAVREMMFGLRDVFDYVECGACGCLQIARAPADLSRYYPGEYYSYGRVEEPSAVRRLALRHRFAQSVGEVDTPLGRFLVKRYGFPPLAEWARRLGLKRSDAVVDVGCGNGSLLVQMGAAGFEDLTGLDPYIGGDLVYRRNVRVLKRDLTEYDGKCDAAMFHHSFEHLANPAETLERLSGIVVVGGSVLIRTPVAGNHAWRAYGADWYQIDAPRHIFIHTEASMALIASRAGFEVESIVYDSTGRQFWVSEQYKRDNPLNHPRSYAVDPSASPFAPAEIDRFETDAQTLNREGQGDQACFYLRRV